MDKEKIKKELYELAIEGSNIHFSGIMEYDNDFFKNGSKEQQKASEEAVKKVTEPKNAYHAWYDKTCRVVSFFAPKRLEEFEKFYTGSKTIKNDKDLDTMTAGITHYFQGRYIIKNGKKIDFFNNFTTGLNEQRRILSSVDANFDNDLFNVERDISYGVYKSVMDIAKDLQQEDSRIAGAIASVMLEVHLKKIAVKHGIEDKENNSIADYNNFLKTKGVYDGILADQIKPCRKIRNKCVHTNQGDPSVGEVSTIIHIADRVIAEVN